MHSNDHENNSDNRMLTVDEVAQLLHVHPTTVRRWERDDLLKSYRLGLKGNVRFKRQDIAAFIDNAGKPGTERLR